MRAPLRFGLPLIAVLAIVPALIAPTGGPHGSLYSMIVFVLSLPALYGLAWMRDHGIVESEPAIVTAVMLLQYLTYLVIVCVVAALVGVVRRRPRA